jgi:hypothetical protein
VETGARGDDDAGCIGIDTAFVCAELPVVTWLTTPCAAGATPWAAGTTSFMTNPRIPLTEGSEDTTAFGDAAPVNGSAAAAWRAVFMAGELVTLVEAYAVPAARTPAARNATDAAPPKAICRLYTDNSISVGGYGHWVC